MCHAKLDAPDGFEFRPFCSSRCKKLDLLNWLEGNYRLPRELTPEDLQDLPPEEHERLVSGAAKLN